MSNNKNQQYHKQLPRLIKARIKCQSLDPNGTKCNHAAQVEVSIKQGGFLGNLWAAVFLCSGCATKYIQTFSKTDYEFLLEQEGWAKDARKAEKHIAKMKEHNRKAHAHNELVRAKEAGEISSAEFTSGSDAIYPEYAIARAEGYKEAKKEMQRWIK